jgi:hypothetical protein
MHTGLVRPRGARVARLSLVALFATPALSGAQSPRTPVTASGAWLAYTGIHPISERWRWQIEGQVRQTDGASRPSQRLYRTALLRMLNSATRVGAGYAFSQTHPPEEFVVDPQLTSEHRTYEQLDLKLPTGPFVIDNRYRLEQRWSERLGTGAQAGTRLGWTYTNRARYNVKATIAPGGGPPKDGKPYFFVSDEVFVNFGDAVRYSVFDQNRLVGGVGYRFGRMLSSELSYLNQIVVRANGTDEERNNIIVLGFSSEAPLFSPKH